MKRGNDGGEVKEGVKGRRGKEGVGGGVGEGERETLFP